MKSSDINSIVKQLSKEFKTILCDYKCSVIITGSISRGDYEIDNLDNIISDIDILIVIQNSNNIEEIHKKAYPILMECKIQYDCIISLIFTLEKQFIQNKEAHYVICINNNYILFDNLNIVNKLHLNTSLVQDINEKIEYTIQVITFYQAKYKYCGESRVSIKANLAIITILLLREGKIIDISNIDYRVYNDFITQKYKVNLEEIYNCKNINHFGINNNLSLYLKDIIKDFGLSLDSSRFFYENQNTLDKEILWEEVRGRVFMENQGISFTKSYYYI